MKQKNTTLKPYFPNNKQRKPMVSWFSPLVLLQTLKDLVLSKIVGSQVDTRELQSVNENSHDTSSSEVTCKIQNPYKLNHEDDDFYFDFIADTGDGWDSTYTMASLLSRDFLLIKDKGENIKLPRGEFLLLGGDEIYPSPSEENYQQRLISPFTHAWDWLWLQKHKNNNSRDGSFIHLQKQPEIYAIPGNHDWYDSLIAFRKVFCNIFNLNQLGRWKTNQSRSYFAIGLPHDWVILALDFGLDQYKLDGLQYYYFKSIIQNLKTENKLIIMASEPQWNYGGVQNKKLNQAYKDIEALLASIFIEKSQTIPKIYLNLSGDTHNYQKYVSLQGEKFVNSVKQCSKKFKCTIEQEKMLLAMGQNQHKRYQIVSGGGGAFLHPTHITSQQNMQVIPNHEYSLGDYSDNPDSCDVEVKDLFELQNCYPNQNDSKKLATKLYFSFLLKNYKLALFIATVYLVLAWPMRAFMDSLRIKHTIDGFADSGLNFLTLLISLLLIIGFTLWARTEKSKALTIAGIIHGILQATLLYGGYMLVYMIVADFWYNHQLTYGWFLFPIIRDSLYFILMSILSPLLLATALWIYPRYFKANQNDLFGSGSIANHKHLLRFKIDKTGNLHVYPIAVEKVKTYSMPSEQEVTDEHLKQLIKHNGKNWNKIKCCSPINDLKLAPELLKYDLIEDSFCIIP